MSNSLSKQVYAPNVIESFGNVALDFDYVWVRVGLRLGKHLGPPRCIPHVPSGGVINTGG